MWYAASYEFKQTQTDEQCSPLRRRRVAVGQEKQTSGKADIRYFTAEDNLFKSSSLPSISKESSFPVVGWTKDIPEQHKS